MKDSYLANGVTVARVATLFEVSRELWQAAPWEAILTDDSLLRVSCADLGLEDAVVSVVGQHRTIFGFLLFPGGLDAFVEFERAARRHSAPKATQLSLCFITRRELSVRLRREAQKFRWPLPTEDRYPVFTTADRRGARPPTADELNKIEAVARALTQLVQIEPNLQNVTFGIGSMRHTLDVSTVAGSHQLHISAPCMPEPEDDLVFVETGRGG